MSEVKERWWHRLLGVLLAGFVLIVACASLFFAYSSSKVYVVTYSWRADWKPGEESRRCYVTLYESIESENTFCGYEFKSSTDVLVDMLSSRYIRVTDLPASRSKMYDARILQGIFETKPSYWRGYYEIQAKPAIKAFSIAAVVILVASWLSVGFFKLVIYIAHGPYARLVP